MNALPLLHGRRIVLGVTGGIAAYKSAEVVRRLRDAGAEVQVVLTEGGARFITEITLQALSGHPVRSSLWDAQAEASMGHIELARWPDAILIAPASADFLARLAHGLAPDLLSTLCLATDRPIMVAPAMNRLMWANAATQANLAQLRARQIQVIGPASGSQACGETGEGRMEEAETLVAALAALFGSGPLEGRHAVITAGPTREAVDPVRVLTNRSSGKMGFAVAEALAALGAQVTLIAGPVSLPTPTGVRRHDVETAAEMLEASMTHGAKADIFVGTAAVADYRPSTPKTQKIKKAADSLTLKLERTEDILARVRAAFPKLFMVGFAAETEQMETHARDKLARKGLQLIAANLVGDGRAFDQDDNALQVYWPDGSLDLGHGDKRALARKLAALIAEHHAAEPQPSRKNKKKS
jgi:phosphopantothenoylcysteine decarboxylase/phosphopantothenate--cysteine ligase